MNNMKFETADLTATNIAKLNALFPNLVTEGKVNLAALRAFVGEDVWEREAYEFTWVGKREAVAEAGRPIRKTLRPCREKSVNFDTTENLYIEGDNLDVLKLLQESYLGKVKMIYIDPPYNTGKDSFVYPDDYRVDDEEYEENIGLYDEVGNKLFKENTSANPRFHSDWCSMIYPRLVLARNLLRGDGVIFISIDDNEVAQLRKICDEVFGAGNFVGQVVVKSNPRGSQSESQLAGLHEYMLIYAKSLNDSAIAGHKLTENMIDEYKFLDNGRAYRLLGLRQRGGFWRRSERPNLFFPIFACPQDGMVSLQKSDRFSVEILPVQPTTGEDGTWRWSKDKINANKNELIAKVVSRNGDSVFDVFQKDYLDRGGERRTKAKSLWEEKEINYQNGTIEVKELLTSGAFDYAKPVYLMKRALEMIECAEHDIILDFFSGSATTAHAVMQLNAEDAGHRKFIMVQLPELCKDGTEAAKAGYGTICDIGRARITKAGEKIVQNLTTYGVVSGKNDLAVPRLSNPEASDTWRVVKNVVTHDGVNLGAKRAAELDVGFRVLRLDETNMRDVYYNALEWASGVKENGEQLNFDDTVDNIKPDRTPEDLLYACLLEWGLPLNQPHVVERIAGFNVQNYNGGDLLACFEKGVTEELVRELAKRCKAREPLASRVVFRDDSFTSSPQKINLFEIFKLNAPNASVRVI